MNKTNSTLLAACLVLLLAGGAAAYSVDFTLGSFGVAAGSSSYTFDILGTNKVTITALPENALLNHNAGKGLDGFGVVFASGEPDEVEYPEQLRVDFLQPVFISKMLLTNLFIENFVENNKVEYVIYALNGSGFSSPFYATNTYPNNNGELTINVDPTIMVYSILFSAPAESWGNDFSVAKIDASNVPIPNAVWLLGTGLIGIVGLRRKFKR
jgi:hypothetical protein